jgi:hypothetical protein
VNLYPIAFEEIEKIRVRLADDSGSDIDDILSDLDTYYEGLIQEIKEIEAVDPKINDPLPPIQRKYRTIDSFEETEILQLFRFESKDQLHRLFNRFRFPNEIKHGSQGNKFSGEEVMLCGIFRLHSVNTLVDTSWESIFGMLQSVASTACKLFFDCMWNWWSYLLFDHMNFWA